MAGWKHQEDLIPYTVGASEYNHPEGGFIPDI